MASPRVDLTIQPGETFGLLGPDGAGKTTTIRMLVTLLKPMGGRIGVFGSDTSLDDVFRHFTGGTLDEDTAKGGIRDVRRARRTARRLG